MEMLSNKLTNGKRIQDLIRNQDPCMVPVYQDDSYFPPTLIISKDGTSNYLRAIVFGADSSVNMDVLEIPSDYGGFSDVPVDLDDDLNEQRFSDSSEHYRPTYTDDECELPDILANKQPLPPPAYLDCIGHTGVTRNIFDTESQGNIEHTDHNGTITHTDMPRNVQVPTHDAHHTHIEESSMLRHLLEPLSMTTDVLHQNSVQLEPTKIKINALHTLTHLQTNVHDDTYLGKQHNVISSTNYAELRHTSSLVRTSTGDEAVSQRRQDPVTAFKRKEAQTRHTNYRPLSQIERQQRYKQCMHNAKKNHYKRKLKLTAQELGTDIPSDM